jgi:BlaI family transcriptional regulator, penicillinase repressor
MSSMRRAPSLPTEAELAILRVLWRRGPSTVREVQATLEQDRPTGYTTALKFLQIMFEKGLVLRDESARTHVYRARSTEQQTKRQLLRDLTDRAFDGSTAELIREAIALKPPTRDEAAGLRSLLRSSDPAPSSRTSTAGAASKDDRDQPEDGRLF